MMERHDHAGRTGSLHFVCRKCVCFDDERFVDGQAAKPGRVSEFDDHGIIDDVQDHAQVAVDDIDGPGLPATTPPVEILTSLPLDLDQLVYERVPGPDDLVADTRLPP